MAREPETPIFEAQALHNNADLQRHANGAPSVRQLIALQRAADGYSRKLSIKPSRMQTIPAAAQFVESGSHKCARTNNLAYGRSEKVVQRAITVGEEERDATDWVEDLIAHLKAAEGSRKAIKESLDLLDGGEYSDLEELAEWVDIEVDRIDTDEQHAQLFADQAAEYVGKQGDAFELQYTEDELKFFYYLSKSFSMDNRALLDMVLTGSRKKKRRSATTLMLEIRIWSQFVSPERVVSPERGIPFRFKSFEDFRKFKVDLIGAIEGASPGSGIAAMPANDVRIQGSSLRNPKAGDVDLAVFVGPGYYAEICHTLYDQRFTAAGIALPASYNDMVVFLNDPATNGVINGSTSKQKKKLMSAKFYILRGMFDGHMGNLTGLAQITNQLAAKYKHLNVESISILLRGGAFELKPDMKIEI